jgi:hypothetical protein
MSAVWNFRSRHSCLPISRGEYLEGFGEVLEEFWKVCEKVLKKAEK